MAFKIAYCAGHGYNTAGKRTPDGEREWTFNNKNVLAFEREMSKYEGVQLKRMDDPTGKTDVPLTTRTNGANAWGADIYISFHHNANTGKWGAWTGTETFINIGSASGRKLANYIHKYVLQAYGLRNRGILEKNLHIVRETKMPAILIEGGFMDSTIDIKKLRDDNVLAKAGIGVAKGVAEYAGLKLKAVSKPVSTVSIPEASGSYPNGSIGKTTIVADSLNIRDSYSLSGKIVGQVSKGKTYFVYKNVEGWLLLGNNQWISGGDGKYASFTERPVEPEHLYRVRLNWEDASSQKGAFANLDGAKEVAEANKGYKVFDENGKVVYDPTPAPVVEPQMYRVRKTWEDAKSQLGAFTVLDSAKELADRNAGYKVFDKDGKVVYTPVVKVEPTPAPKPVEPTPQPEPVKPAPTPQPIPVDHTGHHDIMGKSVVEADKMVAFVKDKNPTAQDIEEIAKAFISVGEKYGVRGDIAFVQSLIETGWFRFDGGTAVTPDQHNYCGLGVTSKGMKGSSFPTVVDGVTAQIQHLFAYASKNELPSGEQIIDPRFKYVTRGVAPHWEDLSNRWAMNANYGTHIISLFDSLVKYEYVPPVVETQPEPQPEIPVEDIEKEQEEKAISIGKKLIDYLIEQLKKLFKL